MSTSEMNSGAVEVTLTSDQISKLAEVFGNDLADKAKKISFEKTGNKISATVRSN